jgi:hypothetical protein
MAITFEFRENICYYKTEGRFSKADLDEQFQIMRMDPQFSSCKAILLQDTKSKYLPTTKDIKSAAFGVRQMLGGFEGKIAIIVESQIKYGMGRMLEALTPDSGIRVFKSMDEAEEWLSNK